MKGAFDVYFISDFDTELSDVPFQKENWMNVILRDFENFENVTR